MNSRCPLSNSPSVQTYSFLRVLFHDYFRSLWHFLPTRLRHISYDLTIFHFYSTLNKYVSAVFYSWVSKYNFVTFRSLSGFVRCNIFKTYRTTVGRVDIINALVDWNRPIHFTFRSGQKPWFIFSNRREKFTLLYLLSWYSLIKLGHLQKHT